MENIPGNIIIWQEKIINRKSERDDTVCRPFYIYFTFVLIATILGMYIVITVKSDAEHQTRVMESMIANEISKERSRHIRTLKNTYREIYRVPGCGRGYEVTEAWGCNI